MLNKGIFRPTAHFILGIKWSSTLLMLRSKLVQSFVLLLFIGTVTLGILFLLTIQLAPIIDSGVDDGLATRGIGAAATVPPLTPTSTMPALTLDMLATIQPTVLSAATVVEEPLPTSTPPGPINPNARIGIVTGDLINIRSYPSLAGEVVGQAKQGERFEIITSSNDGEWYQVCCPLGTAEGYQQSWIAAEFISLQQAVQSNAPLQASAKVVAIPTQESSPDKALVTPVQSNSKLLGGTIIGALVNVRSGPGTNYAVVAQVSEQSQVEVTGRDETGAWWRICCPAGAPTDSWISAEFVELSIAKTEAMTLIPSTTAISKMVIVAVQGL
jgi:SH3-like domain-containing protein